MKIWLMVASMLIITTIYGVDHETQAWIDSLQAQTTAFAETIGQNEVLDELMNQEDKTNPMNGHTSVRSIVNEAAANNSGALLNEHLGKANDKIQGEKYLNLNSEQTLAQSIGKDIQNNVFNGNRFIFGENDSILQFSNQLLNLGSQDSITLNNFNYEEKTCAENIHQFNETVKEKLIIELEEGYVKTQEVSLYAASNNEFSVSITGNLQTGTITSSGNGTNVLHSSSNVTNPLGGLPAGAAVLFERTKPYDFWNGLTEHVVVSLGQEPSQNNGYTYTFGLSQNHCNNNGYCNQYRGMQHHWKATITVNPKIKQEYWMGAEKYSALEKNGTCVRLASKCLMPSQTKQFGVVPLQIGVKRDCWERETIYQCAIGGVIANNCAVLREKGCDQIASNCQKQTDGVCVLHEQTFRCPLQNETSSIDLGFNMDELSRDAYQKEYVENDNFGQALAALSLSQSFATEKISNDNNQGYFLGGKAEKCETLPTQCCANKGIFKKLFGCTEEEEALAPKVEQGLCHLVGETKTGDIIHKKKRHYCCYHSLLARVAQEGARDQLGIGFGSADEPNCGALSVNDIQRVNWELVNFSEVIQEFSQKAKNNKLSTQYTTQKQNQFDNNQKLANIQMSNGINNCTQQLAKESPNPSQDLYKELLDAKGG